MIYKLVTTICFLLTVATFVCGQVACAQAADEEIEYQVKAGFLFNFAKFMHWPQSSFDTDDQLFKICVLGDNPFGSTLMQMKSWTIQGKRIDLYFSKDIQKVKGCHLVFISASEKENLKSIYEILNEYPIVMVSDIDGFAESCGTIEFVMRDSKLTFKINLKRAREQGVQINSSLLNLALEVIQ